MQPQLKIIMLGHKKTCTYWFSYWSSICKPPQSLKWEGKKNKKIKKCIFVFITFISKVVNPKVGTWVTHGIAKKSCWGWDEEENPLSPSPGCSSLWWRSLQTHTDRTVHPWSSNRPWCLREYGRTHTSLETQRAVFSLLYHQPGKIHHWALSGGMWQKSHVSYRC